MSDKKPTVLGFYREAVDIRHLTQGKIQIAPETIVQLPRSGMYKLSTSVLLLTADEEATTTFTPEEVDEMKKGKNIVDLKTGKPYDPKANEDEKSRTWGTPANDNNDDNGEAA